MIEGQIPSSELLVSDEHPVVAPIEDQVREESTRTIVHKDAFLSIVGATLNHFKDDVLQAGSLSNLPLQHLGVSISLLGRILEPEDKFEEQIHVSCFSEMSPGLEKD